MDNLEKNKRPDLGVLERINADKNRQARTPVQGSIGETLKDLVGINHAEQEYPH
jgi:hypothetical protein